MATKTLERVEEIVAATPKHVKRMAFNFGKGAEGEVEMTGKRVYATFYRHDWDVHFNKTFRVHKPHDPGNKGHLQALASAIGYLNTKHKECKQIYG